LLFFAADLGNKMQGGELLTCTTPVTAGRHKELGF
jgi:hypothetical protein